MTGCRRCADPKFNFYRHVRRLIPHGRYVQTVAYNLCECYPSCSCKHVLASDNQREWGCRIIGSFIYPGHFHIKSSVLRYTTFFRLGMKRKVLCFTVTDTAQHVAVLATVNHPFILIYYKVFICKCFKVSSSSIS